MISLHSNDVRIRNPKREQLARDAEAWLAKHEPTTAKNTGKSHMTVRDHNTASWLRKQASDKGELL